MSDQSGDLIGSKYNATGSANQELKFHPLADIFPLMEGAELDALVEDIKKNGLQYPIFLYEGKILDGRNRYRACLAAGFEPVVRNWIGGDPASFVISRNIRRRHLSAEQKRELIAKLLKAQPEKSDRQIAKAVKASPTFVGKVRAEKEATGDVSTVDTRTDTKGRKQPAKRKRRGKLPKPSPEAKAAHDADWEAFKKDDPLEKLRAAEIKIVALEAEVEELKRENAELRRQLEATRAAEPLAGNDPGPMPESLRREATAS
jgi:hypothetical protein